MSTLTDSVNKTDIIRTSRFLALTSLSEPRFRAWFLSQVLSASGLVTQSVAASWLILQLTHSPSDLALLTVLTLTPTLVLGSWAGSLSDRFDRRRLLMVTQTVFLVLGLTLFAAAATHRAGLPVIYALSAATGLVATVDGPARQVYVLDLVGPGRLASAVSLYEVVINLSRILGPAMGGLLLATSGPAACFLLNALTYLPPLGVLLAHRGHTAAAASANVRSRPVPAGTSVRDGIRYAWRTPAIRSCLLLAAATCMLFNSSVVFPLLAHDSLHLGAGGYGLLVGSFGIGALPGALLAASRPGVPSGRLVARLGLLSAIAVLVTSLAPTAVLAYVGMAVTGLLSIWFIATANTLVQLTADPSMRGRVMGLWTVALPGTGPVSAVLVALLIEATSARVGFAATGLAIGLIAATTYPALTSASTSVEVSTPVPGQVSN